MRAVEPLTHQELIVLAGLVRAVVLADRVVDGAELDALGAVGDRVVDVAHTQSAAYRQSPRGMGSDSFRRIFSEANRELPDLETAREAAAGIDDDRTREVIFALVSDVAHATGVGAPEQELLDWLADLWSLHIEPA